jgi:chromosome segregation ATPase
MLNFLKKGKEDGDNPGEEVSESAKESKKIISKGSDVKETGSSSDSKQLNVLAADVEKIKASVEGFNEIRKSFTERFSRISEQIGELRAMILERDKSIQQIELKSLKAYELVESVHPEKIMTEVQKQDAKSEALKANLEGNEAIMERVMEELKEAKRKIEFFRGIEEIIKLSEEVKKELIEIKKIEMTININTDKVSTIYGEIRKKFQDIDSFKSDLQESKVETQQNIKDIQFLKDKISTLAEKDELEKLMTKLQRYIEALKSIEKKSSMTKDLDQLKVLLEGFK